MQLQWISKGLRYSSLLVGLTLFSCQVGLGWPGGLPAGALPPAAPQLADRGILGNRLTTSPGTDTQGLTPVEVVSEADGVNNGGSTGASSGGGGSAELGAGENTPAATPNSPAPSASPTLPADQPVQPTASASPLVVSDICSVLDSQAPNLRVLNSAGTWATIKWDHMHADDSVYYEVYLDEQQVESHFELNVVTLNGLKANTLYTFSITAFIGNCQVGETQAFTFKTQANASSSSGGGGCCSSEDGVIADISFES